ncbi:MAG: hypothetical protein WBP29_02950 [Candidatus Zixiibacteriota bacterium]
MNTIICTAAICAAAVVTPLEAAEPATAPVVITVEIRVDDMAVTLNFYCGLLLFEKSGRLDSENEVSLSHADAEILLKRVAKRAARVDESGVHANLNLMISDLEDFVVRARDWLIQILDSVPQSAQIGSFYRVLDPARNLLHLIQPNFDFSDLSKPVVFNLGILVTDMIRSREFHFATLGFSPLKDKVAGSSAAARN